MYFNCITFHSSSIWIIFADHLNPSKEKPVARIRPTIRRSRSLPRSTNSSRWHGTYYWPNENTKYNKIRQINVGWYIWHMNTYGCINTCRNTRKSFPGDRPSVTSCRFPNGRSIWDLEFIQLWRHNVSITFHQFFRIKPRTTGHKTNTEYQLSSNSEMQTVPNNPQRMSSYPPGW